MRRHPDNTTARFADPDGNALDLKLAEAKPRPLVSVDEAGALDEHLREVAVLETCRQRQPVVPPPPCICHPSIGRRLLRGGGPAV